MITLKNIEQKSLKFRQYAAISLLGVYIFFRAVNLLGVVKPPQKFLYLLDSGHGYYGNTCGSKAILESNGTCFYEWIFNWNVRRHLAIMLENEGVDYKFVNTNLKSDLSLDARIHKANIIKSKTPKILISIHANAASDKEENWQEAHGFEVYSPRSDKSHNGYEDKVVFSDTLAIFLQNELSAMFPKHEIRLDGGKHKKANFEIIAKTNCYAILSENEFFTNPKMRELMRTDEFAKKVALAHFNFIKKLEKR